MIDNNDWIPGSIVTAEMQGAHPIKAWRDHRGLTLEKLAHQCRLSKAYLSQIENRKRKGSLKTHRTLSKILKVPMDILFDSQ